MRIDSTKIVAGLGGTKALAQMNAEEKADALEHYLAEEMSQSGGSSMQLPSAADVEAAIEGRTYRRGVGGLFLSANHQKVKRLAPLPPGHKLEDFFRLRFMSSSSHCLQSANLAVNNGAPEEVILACLLHDTVQALMRVDHGWWGAQLYEPYVSEKVAFAIRYHQALRFYEDKDVGYNYPELYRAVFGQDYQPEPYIEATYKMVRKHKWYALPRAVTVNDLYSFEKGVNPSLEQFADIIGRNFKQPKEGLGYDNSPVAHMWRSIEFPDHPL